MKIKPSTVLILATMLLLVQFCGLMPCGMAASYSGSFQLLEHLGGSKDYRLNVAISQSLQDYYVEKSHRMSSANDFGKFVTPYALEPIADCLGEIYSDDEDFVNGVLMIVHQIPYEVTASSKYPVETMVDNKGDCDLLSYIAASIIKAHGLDVVLLYYESESHINIGVRLSQTPNDARENVFHVSDGNLVYYMAECTGGNWQTGWRVGECPDTLEQASVQIITLEDCEQTAPGQVSASYRTLVSSTLSLVASPSPLMQGGMITVSGQISPALQSKRVTLYIKINGMSWTELTTATTDSDGRFSTAWIADTAGIGYVRASWPGDSEHAGADSPTQIITVLSTFFIVLLGVTIMLVAGGVVIYVISRKAQQGALTPQPPEIPT